jgi:AcrR family transcriptional regulator
MTLYHHFPSEDDLILAVLARRRAQRQAGFDAAIERSCSPRAKIPSAFDARSLLPAARAPGR